MATNGNLSEDESPPGSPDFEPQDDFEPEVDDGVVTELKPKSALKKPSQVEQPAIIRPELPPQPDPKDIDASKLTPLSPEIVRHLPSMLIRRGFVLT